MKEDRMLTENEPITVEIRTSRTNRIYSLQMSAVSMYAGTYDLTATLNDYQAKIAKDLNIDQDSTDYHPDQLDFDAQDIVIYALDQLVKFNRDLISVKLS